MGMQFEMSWRLHIQQPCPFESSCSIVVIYNNYHYNRCSVIGSFCVGNCENYVLAMLEGIMYLPSEDYIACITPVIRYHVFPCQKAPYITPVRRYHVFPCQKAPYITPVRRYHVFPCQKAPYITPVRRYHVFPYQKAPYITPVRRYDVHVQYFSAPKDTMHSPCKNHASTFIVYLLGHIYRKPPHICMSRSMDGRNTGWY